MTTDATMDLLDGLRTFLLDFAPLDGGATLRALLAAPLPTPETPTPSLTATGQLFHDDPPDDAAGCYAAMRLVNRLPDGADGGVADRADLEVMLFSRGRTKGAKLRREQAADTCEQALLRYIATDASGGLLWATGDRQRDTLPRPVAPADADVGQTRLVYGLELWPAYLAQSPDP